MGDDKSDFPRCEGGLTRRSDSTEYVRSRWPFLSPHIREAIVTLVDAGLAMNAPDLAREKESDDAR